MWSNIKRYAIYRKLLVSYLALVLLSILLISTVLYQRFSYQAEAEINRSSVASLEQLDQAADSVYDRVVSVGSELLHDPGMINAMLSDKTDPLLENEVVIRLKNIQAVYPFIEYISVYNGNTGRYLNYKGIDKQTDREAIDLIRSGGADAYMRFAPRLLTVNNAVGAPTVQHILSFVLYSNFSNLIPRNGALVININDAGATGGMLAGMAATPDSKWMIADGNGRVLSHSDSGLFLSDLSADPVFARISQARDGEGYFKADIDGKRQLVVYKKSAKTGWITIGTRPYEPTLLGVDRFQLIAWGTGLVLAIAGILLSFALAGRMYTPYSIFQKQQHTMESSLRKAYPIVRETYLRRLLSGKPEMPGAYADMLEPAPGDGFYCVIMLKIDDYRRFSDRSYKEQDLIRFAIRNIADEMMTAYGDYHTLEVESDHLAILARLREQRLPDNLILTLVELGQTVRQYFKLSVTAAIGDIAARRDAVNDSYRTAGERMKYRLFLGHGSIIDEAAATPYAGRRGEYPAKTEGLLLDAIHLGHRREADKEIERFVAAIRAFDYKYAFVYANQLVISVQSKFDSALSFEQDDRHHHGSLLYSFSEFETLEEIGAALKNFCATIIDRLEEKRAGRGDELIEAVCRLVRERYSDPTFSLDWAADHMRYSAGHLSKLFKQATGQSFNDYVNRLRMEEAVRLLRTTDRSATAISEKLGLGSTYFFTLFKKTYGMTPAQYRSRCAAAETADGAK